MNRSSLETAAKALARNLEGADPDWAEQAARACIESYLRAEKRRIEKGPPRKAGRRTSPEILAAVERVRAGEHPIAVCKSAGIPIVQTLYAALKRAGVTFDPIDQRARASTPEARAKRSAAQRKRSARIALRHTGIPATPERLREYIEVVFGEPGP